MFTGFKVYKLKKEVRKYDHNISNVDMELVYNKYLTDKEEKSLKKFKKKYEDERQELRSEIEELMTKPSFYRLYLRKKKELLCDHEYTDVSTRLIMSGIKKEITRKCDKCGKTKIEIF